MIVKWMREKGPLGLSARVIATALELARAKASARYVLLPFFIAVSAAILSQWGMTWWLEAWTGVNIALALLWFPLKNVFLPRLARPGLRPWREVTIFAAYIFTGACAWASIGLMAWVPNDAQNNYILIMMMAGDVSIAMFALAPMLAFIIAGALPSLIMVLILPLVYGMPNAVSVVALCGLYLAVLGAISVVMRRAALESMRLREERADLVAELSDLLTQAERQRDQALGANRSKSDFVIKVAHDMRGPLNAILGFSEIIRDEVLGTPRQVPYRRFGEDIHNSGIEALNLIENLQQVLKIESGNVELHPDRLNLDLVVGRALHAIQMRAEARHVTLTMHVPGGIARLWADMQAVDCMLDQLLGHAIRKCPPHGTVSVSAGVAPEGGILVRVLSSTGRRDDAGQEALEHVPSNYGHEWWLPIARGLIELHGGTLDLQAREDGGILILLTFPPERSVSLSSIRAQTEAA